MEHEPELHFFRISNDFSHSLKTYISVWEYYGRKARQENGEGDEERRQKWKKQEGRTGRGKVQKEGEMERENHTCQVSQLADIPGS